MSHESQDGERSSSSRNGEVLQIRASFLAYLTGAKPHPDTGAWFGSDEDLRKGIYWWRSELRKEIERCAALPEKLPTALLKAMRTAEGKSALSAIGTSPRWFIETIAGPAFTRDELRAEAKAMLERPTAPPASAVSHDATSEVHSCSYYCGRPECVKAQRDELRDRLERSATVSSQDAKRLLWLVRDAGIDGIGDSDLHVEAGMNAHILGRDEPTDDDYTDAIRTAIDKEMASPESRADSSPDR